jgi:hypothetical protein
VTDFDLHRLGWHDFQQVCHTIAREVLGQTVEAFLPTNDAGRDGAFTGTWREGEEELVGRFVLQCKHTTRPGTALGPRDLADEIDKAARLAAAGRCDVYVLMTNAGLSGKTQERLEDQLTAVGVKHTRCFGREWLNLTLTERKRLRMLVPRLYGLGDLTQILDDRSYRQAQAVLEGLRPDLAKIVRTGTYEGAAEALDLHGFVLLLGEPAAGKTTIAAQLSLAAADVYEASVVKLDSAGEFTDRWNPDEPTQFFWLDDAFGTTQLEVHLAREWTRVVPRIQAAVSAGTRVVVTSRDYIFQAARPHLKLGAFPLLHESRVVVDVHDLTQPERRQILYNHLKHGEQSKEFLKNILPYLDSLADHPGFSPELARRLAHPAFTKGLATSSSLEDFFERPQEFLALSSTEEKREQTSSRRSSASCASPSERTKRSITRPTSHPPCSGGNPLRRREYMWEPVTTSSWNGLLLWSCFLKQMESSYSMMSSTQWQRRDGEPPSKKNWALRDPPEFAVKRDVSVSGLSYRNRRRLPSPGRAFKSSFDVRGSLGERIPQVLSCVRPPLWTSSL